MASVMLPKTKTIEVNLIAGSRIVTLQKLTLGKFSELSKIIDILITQGMSISGLETAEGMKSLLSMLSKAPDQIALLIVLVTDLTKEEALELEIEELSELMIEVWRFNNLLKIFSEALKKAKEEEPQAQAPTLG